MAKSYMLRIYEILETTNTKDETAEAVNLFMLALVVLNVTAVVLERRREEKEASARERLEDGP